MSTATEAALVFDCAGEALVGIVSQPETASDIGIVIIVGGPQYRIGSHRQFVLIARALAEAGYPVLRFDYRSMGDGTGGRREFVDVQDDIAAAVGALQQQCPSVRKVVLWGLCDGASAALLYVQATGDRRIAGLCLLNPWVRSAASLARTQIKHYYLQRLMQPEFWTKLVRGGVAVAALRDLIGNVRASRTRPVRTATAATASFQDRMAMGWKDFEGPILLLLSELDYTAKEFLECIQMQPAWSGTLQQTNLTRQDLSEADHTFSNTRDRAAVVRTMLEWLPLMDTSARAPSHAT